MKRRNAVEINKWLSEKGKFVGDQSMNGGIHALQLGMILFAITGLSIGYMLGRYSKK